MLEKDILQRINDYENPKRIALSKKYPVLKKPIIFCRRKIRHAQNILNPGIKHTKKNDLFNCVIARHQSILRRQLGNSDPELQERKIINLKQAIKRLNGVVIAPNHIFSFWNIVGQPQRKDGYVDGMLLSNGRIIKGVGGGLCQLSNFLHWIFLHAPFKTIERQHHSMDVFPDSGRTLPFGGGATVLYNFVDLKVKNISPYPLQLQLWLTNNHLKGRILSPHRLTQKFHVLEKNHIFIKRGEKYFRFNEIYRETKVNGQVEKTEKNITNFAPVLYPVTNEYLRKNNFPVLDLTNKKIHHPIKTNSKK